LLRKIVLTRTQHLWQIYCYTLSQISCTLNIPLHFIAHLPPHHACELVRHSTTRSPARASTKLSPTLLYFMTPQYQKQWETFAVMQYSCTGAEKAVWGLRATESSDSHYSHAFQASHQAGVCHPFTASQLLCYLLPVQHHCNCTAAAIICCPACDRVAKPIPFILFTSFWNPSLSYSSTTCGSAYKHIRDTPCEHSEATSRSTRPLPAPCRCQAGCTDTSQMVAVRLASDVALANPRICPF
jgi:hypothetical protein